MGNAIHLRHRYRKPKVDELQESLIRKCFWSLSDGNDILKFAHLERKIGPIAEPIFKYLSDNDDVQVTLEEFHKKGLPLLGNSTDIYVKIIQPFEELLKYCFESANIQCPDFNEPFMKAFIENMKSDGNEPTPIARRKNLICPGLIFSIQSRIFDIFYNRKHIDYDYSSDVLTPAQMYIVYGILPETVYFCHNPLKSPEDFNGKEWELLLSTKNGEITPDIFQKSVFDYKGPTVIIIRNNKNELFAVANDEQWTNSSKKIGGNYCVFIKLLPEFRRFDGSNELYCNFNNDSFCGGMMWGPEFLVQNDMSDIKAMEVWGCGIPQTYDQKALDEIQREAQASEQKQQRSAAPTLPKRNGEFNAKQQDDEWNVDKQLLEMAGYEFDRHKRVGPVRPPDEDEKKESTDASEK